MRQGQRQLRIPRRGAPDAALALALVTLAALAGCARRGDLLGLVPALDGSSPDDRDAADGGLPTSAPRFAPPTLVGPLSDPADDEDPSFTGDALELYFSSTRAGTADIWVSRRTSMYDLWGPPARVAELSSSTAIDRSPSVSLNGQAIWFATDRDTGRGQIWRSSRPGRFDTFGAPVPWGTPVPVLELASPNFDSAPSVDASETTMFFTSFRPGTTGYDIFTSTRPGLAASWAQPLRVPGLDTVADEADPFVAQGGLVVFFALTRGGGLNSDLYWSARHSTDAPFPPPLQVEGVNSPFADSDPTLSPDLFYMMFSSSRSGNFEIYDTHVLGN